MQIKFSRGKRIFKGFEKKKKEKTKKNTQH